MQAAVCGPRAVAGSGGELGALFCFTRINPPHKITKIRP